MSKPPDLLLRLLRGAPRQRVCTLFIIGFKFTFFVSIMIYWHVVGEPKEKGQLYNLPAEIPCPTLTPPTPPSHGPTPGNIFFLETSDRTNPNFLFMCSVESAARTHPESHVLVLMKGLPGGNASLPRHLGISLLSCFPNVQMLPLDLRELFRDTPLADWYAAVQGRWEPYLLPVLSDASRIALMWKFGGIYLDTDFIVLKNLRNLTNVLGTQSRYVLNGAFLAFERRHEFMALCMRDFVDHYNGWIWGHQGPQLLTRSSRSGVPSAAWPRAAPAAASPPCPLRPSTPSPGRTGRSTLRTSTPRSCRGCSVPPMLSTCGTRRARARGSRPRPGHCWPSCMPATAPRRTRP
uniref:Lactosylceramide 4-alpha-galactosyltransferase n=1 Tax=Homo sapiens TaxID=9606 RepID=Q7Z7C5_HUMAN|nr:alpha-1,4-galactosyltransferase [Homo sapiens]